MKKEEKEVDDKEEKLSFKEWYELLEKSNIGLYRLLQAFKSEMEGSVYDKVAQTLAQVQDALWNRFDKLFSDLNVSMEKYESNLKLLKKEFNNLKSMMWPRKHIFILYFIIVVLFTTFGVIFRIFWKKVDNVTEEFHRIDKVLYYQSQSQKETEKSINYQ